MGPTAFGALGVYDDGALTMAGLAALHGKRRVANGASKKRHFFQFLRHGILRMAHDRGI